MVTPAQPEDPPAAPPLISQVRVVRTRYEAGFGSDWHHNPTAQLIYPSRGTMTLHTRTGLWVVPPMRACWLPAFEDHKVTASTGFDMHSVYCEGVLLLRLPDRCGIVTVTALLRELILALEHGEAARRTRHMALLFADEVRLEPAPQLFLPPLVTRRLQAIEAALARDPTDGRTIAQWASALGTTSRSLARAFEREAKMGFTAYRRQARLHAAIRKLADGEGVTSIAIDLGFGSASNFIKLFRESTGMTPKRYFDARGR